MLGMIHGMVRLPEQLLGFLTAGGEKADADTGSNLGQTLRQGHGFRKNPDDFSGNCSNFMMVCKWSMLTADYSVNFSVACAFVNKAIPVFINLNPNFL